MPYGAIVKLEALLDSVTPRATTLRMDLDSDGCDEIFLHNSALQAIVKLDGSASINELDAYLLGHNFGDTLRRQAEHYFRKITANHATQQNSSGIASAHDRIAFKHEISAQDMVADEHAQTLFRDVYQLEGKSIALNYTLLEANAEGMVFRAELEGGTVWKRITLQANCLRVTYGMNNTLRGTMLTRIALAMPSCDGYAGRYMQSSHILSGFGNVLELTDAQGLILDDQVLGGHLMLTTSRPLQLHGAPYFTVSQSEAGFEKIMQAVMLTLQWSPQQGELEIILAVNPGNSAP